jgi:hypothetical protein
MRQRSVSGISTPIIVLSPELLLRIPSLNMRLILLFRQIVKRTRTRKKGLGPPLIQVVRSVTSVVSTHQALCVVIIGQSIKSLKHGRIRIVPKQQLSLRKSLIL